MNAHVAQRYGTRLLVAVALIADCQTTETGNMCLSYKQEHQVAKVEAFKVFSFNENDELISVFKGTNPNGLVFKPNVVIEVENAPPEGELKAGELENHFYAFEKFSDALAVTLNKNMSRTWNLRQNRIVLPVTLYDVRFKGYLTEVSDDPQCMDAQRDAFMSKLIKVHDTPETRAAFERGVANNILNWIDYMGFSPIERNLIKRRLSA